VIRRIVSERERVKGNGGTQGLAGDRCGEQREKNVANRVGTARTVLGRGIGVKPSCVLQCVAVGERDKGRDGGTEGLENIRKVVFMEEVAFGWVRV